MTPKRRAKATAQPSHTAALHRALGQSEQVKEKVQEAAQDLSDVNAVLKDDVVAGVPLVKVRRALDKSVAVEIKVQEAAEELMAVNNALSEEIVSRDALENRLSQVDAALLRSRTAAERARHRALHDAVTELPNATLFADRLTHAIDQARRHRWRFAVMFMDLDGFKQINDTHGHDVGDRVLQHVATCLNSFVRGGDSVARRGGDEFLVLMLEVQDDESATAFAAKLVARVGEECEIEGVKISPRASIGIALFPDDGENATELLKCADIAMYAAKREHLGFARYGAPVTP